MEHDDLSVLRQLNVELDSVAVGRGTLERGQRILRHGFITFMQPTVGKITVLERRFLLLADLAGSNEVYKSADSGSSGKCGKLCGVYLFFIITPPVNISISTFYTPAPSRSRLFSCVNAPLKLFEVFAEPDDLDHDDYEGDDGNDGVAAAPAKLGHVAEVHSVPAGEKGKR